MPRAHPLHTKHDFASVALPCGISKILASLLALFVVRLCACIVVGSYPLLLRSRHLEPSLLLGRFLGFGNIAGKELVGRVIVTDVPKVLSTSSDAVWEGSGLKQKGICGETIECRIKSLAAQKEGKVLTPWE